MTIEIFGIIIISFLIVYVFIKFIQLSLKMINRICTEKLKRDALNTAFDYDDVTGHRISGDFYHKIKY